MTHPFAISAPLSTSRASLALPVRRSFRESPAEAVDDPAAENRSAESFWLKEAKATLRSRDPVDAAHDVEALASWADLRCGDILQTSTATILGGQNG